MACFYPLNAFQLENGQIVFAERGKIRRSLVLPCGQCIGCRLERSRQWAMRCLHESKLHSQNSFITLTYADEHHTPSLNYRDFQKFCKRLRKRLGKFRFYMCGEYGGLNGRPHFHACIFGLDFPDKKIFRELPNGNLYTSKILEELWPFGYSTIGDVTFETAAYVARYVMKKITGANADDRYWSCDDRTGELTKIVPEFNRMSLKPGIGARWLEKYMSDVYPSGHVVMNGIKSKPPRYYEKMYAELKPLDMETLQYDRYQLVNHDDQTPERLEVRATVVRAKIKQLKRKL